MTALALAQSCPKLRIRSLRIAAVAIVAVLFAAAAAMAISLLSARAPANAATVQLPPTRAAALVQATAAANDFQAIGEQAKLFNAALPFSGGALHAARPFAAVGSDLDQHRALLCMTQAVYYEAGFEPLEGRRAVAQVVLNRLQHPAFPKSVCGVVYQGTGGGVCQFTFVCDGSLYRAPDREAWREAEAVARAALDGYVETAVGEATHYHADYVAPRWAPLLEKVAQIGQHIFYRWPGAWGQPAAFVGRYIGEPRDPLSLRPPPPLDRAMPSDSLAIQAAAGPPVPRAPDDVGGLLDTSKGWTPHIPGPDESDGATAKLVAAQQGTSPSRAQVVTASAAGTTTGSR